MFGNKDPQPKPVSHYANTNPSAGPNPTSVHATNPYPSGPSKVSFVPPKNTEKNKTIMTLVFALLAIIFAGLFVWKYIDWASLNNKIEMTVSDRIAEEKLDSRKEAEAMYEEYKNSTSTELTGPEEYGSLSLSYPKAWSFYVVNDKTIVKDSKSEYVYEAYANPGKVGPIVKDSVFALRIYIINKPYDDVVESYKAQYTKEEYTYNTIQINNNSPKSTTADVYTGTLENGYKVKAVIFKIRGQTIVVRTDSVENFGTEFDKIIDSISFNN